MSILRTRIRLTTRRAISSGRLSLNHERRVSLFEQAFTIIAAVAAGTSFNVFAFALTPAFFVSTVNGLMVPSAISAKRLGLIFSHLSSLTSFVPGLRIMLSAVTDRPSLFTIGTTLICACLGVYFTNIARPPSRFRPHKRKHQDSKRLLRQLKPYKESCTPYLPAEHRPAGTELRSDFHSAFRRTFQP